MLELRSVTAGYAAHTVLRDVDLTVPEGAVVALLGPNGAGKTTLLRVASGLLRPTAGTVVWDGADVTRWAPDRLARAGLCHVPERRGIFGALDVADNLRLQAPAEIDELAVPIAAAAFPILGARLSQPARTLSGGEQQMLALSRVRVRRPRLALIDEVSTGLAPMVADQIYDHLRSLAADGVTLLVVEQYVGRALELADYVYILRKGRIVFVGEPRQLRDGQIRESYLGV